MSERLVCSRRVVTPEGVRPAALRFADGRIVALEPHSCPAAGAEVWDVGEAVVMPGVVDSHVHVNEPGHTSWEGFASASRAAAAGGVTTLVDMPLNSTPVTTTVAALEAKVVAATRSCGIDHGFWGGVVPGNEAQLGALWEAGVLGFKCFLVDSGLPEFPAVDGAQLRTAMKVLATHGAVLLAHCELPGPIASAPAPAATRCYADYLASRPPQAELAAIDLLLALAAETGCRVHVVHLATPQALPVLAAARREGLPVSIETCPHYLSFDAAAIPDGATAFKCAPPIRDRAAQDGLWQGLADGVIDLVASDHSPCPPDMKSLAAGDFMAAWGGIASLQLTLPALWTGAQARGFGLDDLARWLCAGPAGLAGLDGRKGRLAVGYDADFVVWNPEETFVVRPEHLYHRHPLTPYAGRTLHGVVRETWLRGERVFDRGTFWSRPRGRWQRREAAS